MHEIRIAQDLQKIILEVADKNNLKKVLTVNIQFGEMVQIVPDIFHFAFEEASKGSLVEGSELKIEVLPIKIKCADCLNLIEISKEGSYSCPNCKSLDIEIIQGKEIFIKSIEGE